MGILVEAIREEIGTWRISSLIKAYGGGKRGLAALARDLSGTGDTKSKEYRSQQRAIERWLNAETGKQVGKQSIRKISKKSQKKLDILGGKKKLPKAIRLKGDILIGSEKRPNRTIQRIPPDRDIYQREWDALVDIAFEDTQEEEEEDTQEEEAWDVVADMYSVGSISMEVGDITFLY